MNKIIKLTVIFIIIIGLTISCNNSNTNIKNKISGKVLSQADSSEVGNARVYIFENETMYGFNQYDFFEETITNSNGEYSFQYTPENHYKMYAELFNNSVLEYCSPFVYIQTTENETPLIAEDILLYENKNESIINFTIESYYEGVDTDSINVVLQRRSGENFIPVDSLITDDSEEFQFQNVNTGNYLISIEKTTFVPFEESVISIFNDYTMPFVDGNNAYTEVLSFEPIADEKPAIYIYPEQPSQYKVKLDLKKGVSLTKSIPEYNAGWDVFIDKDGKIDNKYDYLFYECVQFDKSKFNYGYCFSADRMVTSLKKILKEIGLNEIESKDFIEYWGNRFTSYPYYKVYPLLDNEINKYVELKIIPEPESVLRVWLFFEGIHTREELKTPKYNRFDRKKSSVVEWGGVMLN
ncbi:MAG: hypothetical protein K8S23_15790 [Candidatus Cloacimonetes bacterium]|nr:hypothetical protein [Candidatus Cloacimonadota bacterium]